MIPTYNRAEMIGAAVESVLTQTGEGFDCEVIVVDDGSTDATHAVLAHYGPRIRYFRTQNRGVSAARNFGLLQARSAWVGFLDSDDVWHPSKLSEQLECLNKTGSRLCFCVSQSEEGQPLDDLLSSGEVIADGGVGSYLAGDTRIIRAERHPFVQSMLVDRLLLLAAGGFDESLYVAEDTKLIYRLTLSHGYSVLGRRLVTITRNRVKSGLSDSMDAVRALRRNECYLRVQAEILWQLVPLDPQAARTASRRLHYFASRAAEIAAALGSKQRAQRYARFGLAINADWKVIVRNTAILMAYPLVRKHFAKKWRVDSTGADA